MDSQSEEKREKVLKEANLRFIEKNNQCQLSFHLECRIGEFGEFCEDILTIRQVTESLEALIQHTRNKILKIVKVKNDEKQEGRDDDGTETPEDDGSEVSSIDLGISMSNKNKKIDENVMLKALQNMKSLRFQILDVRYKVFVNKPEVRSITLPEIIYSNNSIQPLVSVILGNFHLASYKWFKSKDKITWEELGVEYIYEVKDEDIDYYLKLDLIPRNEYCEGNLFSAITESTVIKMLDIPTCPFEERHKHTVGFLNGNQFRVVTYNTLSCRYTKNQFTHCAPQFLEINYRKHLLFKELVGYYGDIMCLQELDSKVYSFFFRSEFEKLGYGSIYNKKGNRIPEGQAIFYNKRRFSYGGKGQVVLSAEVKSNSCLRNILRILDNDSALNEDFLKQATSMQFCKLISKNTSEIIIVANTHLFYRPGANNVRILQTAVCLEYLKQLSSKESKNNKGINISVIFCGDFNSSPGSDVFKFITKGKVQYDSEDKSRSCPTTLFHSFQFESACGTPKYTNYTTDFKECLDYIFYHNLSLITHVPLPDEDILSENEALPSMVFPSDHIALIADFKFK